MSIVHSILKKLSQIWGWFNHRSLLVKIVIIAAIIGVGWFAFTKIGAEKEPQYQTATVEKGTLVSTISASGNVLIANIISVSTRTSGVVKAVFVKDGDIVSAGQKIAEITLDREGQQENAQTWSSYLSAKNSVESAKTSSYSLQSEMFSKWKTFKDLAESTSYDTPEERSLPQFHVAEKDWLAAEAKYKNQQSVIAQAQASLTSAWLSYQASASIVTTPVAGVVGSLTIVPGMVLSSQTTGDTQTTSSQRVAVIQNETQPLVSVNLTEVDVPKVKIGQKVTITLDSLSEKTFTGKVVAVDRIGTTSNNVTSYPSLIALDTKASEILPNMAASANIIVEAKSDVLLVPSAAIQTQAGQSFVRVLKNGQEQQVSVEVGLSSDTQTEVVSGLTEGDTVITGTATTTTREQTGSIFGGGTFRPGGFR